MSKNKKLTNAIQNYEVRMCIQICLCPHKYSDNNTRSILNYSTVQYSTVQYSTVQYSTVQYSTVQYSTVQYSIVQYSTIQSSAYLELHIQSII